MHISSMSAGLKRVSDDQMSHKNPNLRSQAAPTKTKSSGAAASSKAAVQKRPPLLELEGKKWRVVRDMFTLLIFQGFYSLFSHLKILRNRFLIESVVAGELWAETRPADWGDGAETSGLRLRLQ